MCEQNLGFLLLPELLLFFQFSVTPVLEDVFGGAET